MAAAAAAAAGREEEKCASGLEEGKDEVVVSLFDDSPEGFSSAVRAISEVAGGEPEPVFPASDVERFASMVTFLKEWKHFSYEPKVVSFTCEAGLTSSGDGTHEITLPQFSSATVPQIKLPQDKRDNMDSSDFILFAGGNVWALDWCPRLHNKPGSSISCEYLAVAAHPPDSTYHKVGMPLIGRGIIQIWCLITPYEEVEPQWPMDACSNNSRRGRPKKNPDENNSLENGLDSPKQRVRPRKRPIATSNDLSGPSLKRSRGRPRKCLLSVAKGEQDISQESKSQDLCVFDRLITSRVVPGDLASAFPMSIIEFHGEPTPRKCRGRPRKKPVDTIEGCSAGVELKEDTSILPTSTAVICVEPGQKRRRGRPPKKKQGRGRPRKYPVPSNANHIPDPDVELRKGLTSLPISVGCSTDHIDYTDCSANLSVVSADAPLAVHSSSNANCEKESSSRRGRGRPRKKPVLSALCCSMASGAEAQNTASMPTISNDQVTSVENALPAGGSNIAAMTHELSSISLLNCEGNVYDVHIGVVSADSTLPMHLSPNGNHDKESSGRRGRGRPRKKPISSKFSCSVAFGVESQKIASMPTNSDDHVTLVESAMPRGRSDGEVMASELGSIGSSKCSIDECNVHLNVVSADAALPVHLSPNANCKEESSRKGRGRPRKKPFSTEHGCPMAFGGEVQKTETASTPTMSKNHLASVENAMPLGSSKREVMANELGSIGSKNKTLDCKVMKVDDSNTANKTFTCNIEKEPSDQAVPVHCEKAASLTDEMDDRGLTACKQGLRKEDDNMIICSDNLNNSPIPKDIALPRVVLCLAHNGKVAWDIKWKPPFVNQSEGKCRLGYLATLLGNGSLEVWEVPSPSMVQKIYSSASVEGSDPRFLKLQPVFRCANVKCGNRLSIPLTVEWSPSPPHDMILAGCHDGTVALWKFATNFASQDSKPLMCFTADSVPIRALSWAPYESEENSNIFVTAGEDGLKFWDLRDPYRPLWELATTPRAVLSLDWLKDARCIVVSLEDGTLKFLSLSRSAYDVPVTGRPFVGKKGFSTYQLSEFVIWSVHISRTTGRVAYCVADGTAVHFQLTPRFLEKDPGRNRVPYFLCGSLLEKGKVLKIGSPLRNTPLSNVPMLLKKGPKPCRDMYQVQDLDRERQQNLTNPGGDCNMDPELRYTLEYRPDEGPGTGAIILAGATEQENAERCNSRDDGTPKEFEIFPPKVVALHRLRWNMNKGSERWLCYGGAAGIIRCQRSP